MATLPFSDPSQGSEMPLQPPVPQTTMYPLQKEDIQGHFQVHLRVNPDLPYDRQTLIQLSEVLFPVLIERYPVGARELMKNVWEGHGQKGFEQIWPAIVADLDTQRIMTMLMVQMKQLMNPPQPPPQPPVRSPETQQAVDSGDQAQAAATTAEAQAQMQQSELRTQEMAAKVMQQVQKLLQEQEMGKLKQETQKAAARRAASPRRNGSQ